MKRSFKNLFVIILILISLIAGGIGVIPAYAAGSSMVVVSLDLPTGWTYGYLSGIWGSGASDVYTVGYGYNGSSVNLPLMYHRDSSNWTVANLSLPIGLHSGILYGVWGSSANDIYAVGSGNGDNVPLLYHKDNSGWTVSSPLPPSGWSHSYLNAVWGSSAADVYAVGFGYNGSATMPLLYHKTISGEGISNLSLPGWSSGYLYSVWGSSAADVYVAGEGFKGAAFLPLLFHWNGSGWTEASPSLPTGWNSGYLSGIWGSGASDVYAVGYGLTGGANVPLLYHWNGSGWTEASPSLPTGWNSDYLSGVWGSNASNVYAVGYGHNGSVNMPMLYHSSQTGQDLVAPGDVTNFSAMTGISNGSVNLSWTAPADDAGNNGSGPVDSYLVKYSTSPFSSWNDGTPVTSGLTEPTAPGTIQTMTVSGLTPGTLYYFAIRAQDEQYNLSANYVTASATAKSPPPVGPGTYDDTDAAWSYTGNWIGASQTGPYNNTDHYTNTQNASAAITFTGTQFTVYFTQYSNRGNMDVWIDGTQQYTINENGSLIWQQGWTLPVALSNGTHTVQFKNPNASTSTYIDVDAITITGPVGPGTYDDTDAAWSYTGNWVGASQTGPYNNTDHYINIQNASAAITFTGTQFTVYFTKYSNRGNMDVWIDGTQQYTINENGSLIWQQGWTLPVALSNGTHMVQFKNPNVSTSTYIDVDAITITGPVGPGTYDDANAAWGYTGNWVTASQTGPYNNTDHYTNTQNASAAITFTGTQFTVYFTKYSNRGNMDVWIDGTQQYTINENGSLIWQQGWTLPVALSNGTHTVQFKNPNASTSTYIDVDAITITGPVGPGTYDDANAAWGYTGNWVTASQTGPYNNTDHYTNTQNASAAITFTGTQFTVYFTKYFNRGNMDVWIDGTQQYTINENGSLIWQQGWTLPVALSNGTHMVQFKNPNVSTSTYIDVDAIT